MRKKAVFLTQAITNDK